MTASVSPKTAGARSQLKIVVRPNPGAEVIGSAQFKLGSGSKAFKVGASQRSRKAKQVGKVTFRSQSGSDTTNRLFSKGGRSISSKPTSGGRGALSLRSTKVRLRSGKLGLTGLPNEQANELGFLVGSGTSGLLRNPKRCGNVKLTGVFTGVNGGRETATAKVKIKCVKAKKRH